MSLPDFNALSSNSAYWAVASSIAVPVADIMIQLCKINYERGYLELIKAFIVSSVAYLTFRSESPQWFLWPKWTHGVVSRPRFFCIFSPKKACKTRRRGWWTSLGVMKQVMKLTRRYLIELMSVMRGWFLGILRRRWKRKWRKIQYTVSEVKVNRYSKIGATAHHPIWALSVEVFLGEDEWTTEFGNSLSFLISNGTIIPSERFRPNFLEVFLGGKDEDSVPFASSYRYILYAVVMFRFGSVRFFAWNPGTETWTALSLWFSSVPVQLTAVRFWTGSEQVYCNIGLKFVNCFIQRVLIENSTAVSESYKGRSCKKKSCEWISPADIKNIL